MIKKKNKLTESKLTWLTNVWNDFYIIVSEKTPDKKFQKTDVNHSEFYI